MPKSSRAKRQPRSRRRRIHSRAAIMSLTAVVSVTSNASRPGPTPLSRIRSSIERRCPSSPRLAPERFTKTSTSLAHLQEPEDLVDDPVVELRKQAELLGGGKEHPRCRRALRRRHEA